ncbi:MAG TPA: CsgG/HfaB family protein [Kiritimatiellia bacterium]|nr:CsgG/HfaB family protein [Kiritimatiellia bacterium]
MKRIMLVGLSAAALAMTVSPAHALWGKKGTETSSGNAEMNLGDYKGLKHAVGVKGFKNEAGWRGSWDVGDNLTVMLESALFDSGRFVVVQREQLKDIIAEQDLAASGRTAAAKKVAQTGKIRPAKYLASGALTEVSENTTGGDGGINIKGFRLGAGKNTAQITAIITLTDTTTGEIVGKERVVGKAGGSALRVGYSGAIGGDIGGFQKTPLGEAAQDVINQAVAFMAKKFEEFPFEGSVVSVAKNGQIIINRGSEFGVEAGQSLVMVEEGEELIDPSTGASLGTEEGDEIGELKVVRVSEKVSYADVVKGDKNPSPGTIVKAK